MKNKDKLKGISVADLLLQIQDAQKQISENLEAIKNLLQAQEAEEVKEAEEATPEEEDNESLQWKYYKKYEDAYIANLEGKAYELLKRAKKLDELEDKAVNLGCPMEYDGHHTARHLRELARDFDALDSRVTGGIEKGEFEKVKNQIERIENGEFLQGGLCFDENIKNADEKIADYELNIERQTKYLAEQAKKRR